MKAILIHALLQVGIAMILGLPLLWLLHRWQKRQQRKAAERIRTLWGEGRTTEAIELLLKLM